MEGQQEERVCSASVRCCDRTGLRNLAPAVGQEVLVLTAEALMSTVLERKEAPVVWDRSAAIRMLEDFESQQYHLVFTGIWEERGVWVIGVEGGTMPTTRDGVALDLWVEQNRLLLQPCRVHIGPIPDGVDVMPARTPAQRALAYGKVRTLPGIWHDLACALRADFPDFIVWEGPGECFVEPVRALSVDETAELQTAINAIGLHVRPEIRSVGDYQRACMSSAPKNKRRLSDGSNVAPMHISSVPRAHKRRGLSERAMRLVERDHDLWSVERTRLWSLDYNEAPTATQETGARVFLPATVFASVDLRVLLSVYDTVVLAPPIESSESEILARLGVARSDLASLALAGRLEIVLPCSLERYSAGLLSELSEAAPDAVIGPREILVRCVAASRARAPMLLPALGHSERIELLRALRLSALSGLGPDADTLVRYVELLSHCWDRQEELVDERGMLGLEVCGLGRFVGELYEQITGKKMWLEFGSATHSVEIAASTGAAVCPVDTGGYSEYGHTKVVCSLFDGFTEQLSSLNYRRASGALEGLLGVARDVPILELATTLVGSDISRLRELLSKIAHHAVDPSEFDETISKFNAAVSSFERRKARLKKLDLNGMLAVTAGFVGLDGDLAPLPATYSATYWLLQRLRAFAGDRSAAQRLADVFEGALTAHRPRTTLVARLRSAVASTRGSS